MVATLLDLLTPELVDGVPGFVRSCQTYEGGFSSSSHPYFSETSTLLPFPRPPLGEAHGGYTACALGSWLLLKPFWEGKCEPGIAIHNAVRWLVRMQGNLLFLVAALTHCLFWTGGGRDLGGFRGRTNKLVDGCYSWWVGGCFALLEGLGAHDYLPSPPDGSDGKDDESWDDIEGALFIASDKPILTNLTDELYDASEIPIYLIMSRD